jgi:hypothetical protein
MQEGAEPSSCNVSTNPLTTNHTTSTYDPIQLIYNAVSYGETVWNNVHTALYATDLINLTYIIEEHLQNLITLCSEYNKHHHSLSDPLISTLNRFYSAPELHVPRHHVQPGPLIDQIQPGPLTKLSYNIRNYFTPLHTTESDDYHDSNFTMSSTSPVTIPTQDPKSFYVEDLGISEVSDIVRLQMDHDKQLETDVTTPAAASTPVVPDHPASQRLRINLIRHRFARSSEMTTLKLFKSFVSALRSADKDLTVLPFDSKKQRYTSIVSSKQLEQLNEHELKLYFQPWHKIQHYSLSGFFHLNTAVSFNELFIEPTIAQWLDTYQYSVKLCPSQAEEMAIIGALCYGSLWIYREDLKQHIMQHQVWTDANNNLEQPMIFDLLTRPFRGSKKSTQMIFVTAERSKQDAVREIFKTIYDGSPKAYPRGDMMLFIPTRNGEQYSNEQRDKIIFNHEQYLGEEEVTAIHGLQDLNTNIVLKGGKSTTIRTLLKSLPSTEGMSRSKLFQIVDPNAGQTCTIVSFQKCDRSYIEMRKSTLEKEIRAVLASGETENVFQNDAEGIWFGGHLRTKNGKPIALSVPHRADMEYIQMAESRLKSPATKRDLPETTIGNNPPSQITYSGILRARTQMTQSVSVQDTEGTTTTTTTQTSQTVTAMMEARFQGLETEMQTQKEHQMNMDQRLSHLENRTVSINDNIATMMEHWNIAPAQSQKRRAVAVMNTQENSLSLSQPDESDGGSPMAAITGILDYGAMEE